MATMPTRSVAFPASLVARLHTALATLAFGVTLVSGLWLHYRKIVKNGVAGYPQEWWPSVSATIGDWYPERNIYQILIALTSGPRLGLIFLWWFVTRSEVSSVPTWLFACGIVRTLSCGFWSYITSNDDHDIHDVAMITYIVLTLPWMLGSISYTPPGHVASRRRRKIIAASFWSCSVPMIHFFIQHKVHRIPGAYTYYSLFEWWLIFADVAFDSVVTQDLAGIEITIGPAKHEKPTKSVALEPVSATSSAPVNQVNEKKAVNAEKHFSRPKATTVTLQRLRDPIFLGREAVSFASDVYLSYIFWSIFTSLGLTLFYFSVWKLGLAGHELALLATLSPIFLLNSSLNEYLSTHNGRSVFRLLTLAGLAAYKIDSPLYRLFAVTFANFVSCISLTIDWKATRDDSYAGIIFALGLIMSSVSKLANHQNNPVWPILNENTGGWNKTGIALALLAILETHLREPRQITSAKKEETNEQTAQASRRHWLGPSVGFGTLIFALHCLLAESTTLIAWSWTGYPITGPSPFLHGSFTIFAMSFGLAISLVPEGRRVVTHPAWWAFGSTGCYVMYRYSDWLGYSGGLVLATFLTSIVPVMQQSLAQAAYGSDPVAYFVSWLVAILFDLANVWTVAYAFVPGGPYLRERTDLVLLAQMALLGVGLFPHWGGSSSQSVHVSPKVSSRVRLALAIFSVFAVGATFYRTPTSPPTPHEPGTRMITAGIWTLHFGIDLEGRDSQRRALNLLRDMQLDVVGFLETDLHRIVFGNRDLTRVITEELGYYTDIGPGPNKHTWGAVLLSKFPILNSTHHLLPSPNGELAPAISATLDVWGTPVTVVVSHNGQEEDPLDRELQSTELARIMREAQPNPTIFLGYVVTKPKAPRPSPYEILVTDGEVHDIDHLDWDRWCEYILYRNIYRVGYARISRGTITDTELQVGRFVLPRHGHRITPELETEENRYLRAFEEEMPEPWRFPREYHKEGKNGHHYHVFGVPLYYKVPPEAVL